MAADRRVAAEEAAVGSLALLLVLAYTVAVLLYYERGLKMGGNFTIPPRPTEWLTDNSGVLTNAYIEAQRAKLEEFYQATQHRLVVWIAPDSSGMPPEYYCPIVFNAWAVGRQTHNDGVVLFLFTGTRQGRITVGYGLESALSDNQASTIWSDIMVPLLQAGDYQGAVHAGIDAITDAIS